jgi:lipoprotein NlpD
MPARLSGVAVLPVLLAACATVPVNAPVDSRVAVPQTQALPTASAATTGQIPGYYIVRRGDTLYSVAWQNGLNFRQLAEMNGIRPPYTIYVGQSLRTAPMTSIAPEPGPAPAAAPPPGQVAPSVPAPAVIAPDIRQSQPEPVPAIPGPPARVAAPQPVAAPEPPLPAVVSGWVWPVRGPLLRGYTPEGNGKKGIDIGGRAGQPVMAAAAGRVVYSGSGLVGYGRLIIIKHNDNLLSAYGHNSELLVAEGDYVKAGQVIAKMGSSGTSSTRLYFEIRQDGKPVNPLRYLPRS